MRIFAFVAAQKADFPVRTLCRVCRVSASGFYAYAARIAAGPGPAAAARQAAAGHIARVHASSRCRYGSPRVTAQLAREGIVVNHKAVEREMARQGLTGRCSRRRIRTTWRDPAQVPAADLVHRDFARSRADELWIGDATYIWTGEGWCYLATVVDACSRRLLGWSITDHLRTELCLDALRAAVATRGGKQNLAAGIVFDPLNPGSTPPGRSGPRAGHWASPSRWAPWAIVTTMPWRSRSSPVSSVRPSTVSISPPARTRDQRSSPGLTGTTKPGSTAPSATARQSSTNSTLHSNHS